MNSESKKTSFTIRSLFWLAARKHFLDADKLQDISRYNPDEICLSHVAPIWAILSLLNTQYMSEGVCRSLSERSKFYCSILTFRSFRWFLIISYITSPRFAQCNFEVLNLIVVLTKDLRDLCAQFLAVLQNLILSRVHYILTSPPFKAGKDYIIAFLSSHSHTDFKIHPHLVAGMGFVAAPCVEAGREPPF